MINLSSKLDFLKTGKDSILKLDKKKLNLIIIVCFAVLILDIAFGIRGQLAGIKTIEPKTKKIKNDIAALEKDIAARKQETTRQEGLLKAKKIISEEELSLLLQKIFKIASKNNAKVLQIKHTKEERAVVDKKNPPKLTVINISLDLSCAYHNLGKLINNLENSEEFVIVDRLKITSDADQYLQQNVNLGLKTYVKKP